MSALILRVHASRLPRPFSFAAQWPAAGRTCGPAAPQACSAPATRGSPPPQDAQSGGVRTQKPGRGGLTRAARGRTGHSSPRAGQPSWPGRAIGPLSRVCQVHGAGPGPAAQRRGSQEGGGSSAASAGWKCLATRSEGSLANRPGRRELRVTAPAPADGLGRREIRSTAPGGTAGVAKRRKASAKGESASRDWRGRNRRRAGPIQGCERRNLNRKSTARAGSDRSASDPGLETEAAPPPPRGGLSSARPVRVQGHVASVQGPDRRPAAALLTLPPFRPSRPRALLPVVILETGLGDSGGVCRGPAGGGRGGC